MHNNPWYPFLIWDDEDYQIIDFYEETKVKFADLSEGMLWEYIDSGEPMWVGHVNIGMTLDFWMSLCLTAFILLIILHTNNARWHPFGPHWELAYTLVFQQVKKTRSFSFRDMWKYVYLKKNMHFQRNRIIQIQYHTMDIIYIKIIPRRVCLEMI